MKKIAIVNQRYGSEVNGGSEYYTRLIAEHINKQYDVEVLTTTAMDYDSWKNVYSAGDTTINEVKVRRFPVKRERNMLRFRVVSKLTRILARFKINIDWLWLQEQGPYTPELIRYIEQNNDKYDVFIFITYLYYSTAVGLPKVAEKSILIPTAHNEPYIYFPIYRKVFQNPAGIAFLTDEERKFVQKNFTISNIIQDVIGVGIDIPVKMEDENFRKQLVLEFREKYKIDNEYIVYAGRIDVGKKCDVMFDYFRYYKNKYKVNKLKLVVMGQDMMGVPMDEDIINIGFVPDEDKYAGISGARFLWLPSQFESLSIALLEAMALGIPGLVNGCCEVLKGHCDRSSGAIYYKSKDEFEKCMIILEDENELKEMSIRASKYVKSNYQWKMVEDKIGKMIRGIDKEKL